MGVVQAHRRRFCIVTCEQQHHLCPRNSWCKFWLDKEKYTEVNRLPEVFAKLLKPIFTRLSNQDLLSRCQGGFTQNQNESVNNVLWSRCLKCLKTKFCGYFKVHLAVCDTIVHFNAGAMLELLENQQCSKKLGVQPAPNHLASPRVKSASKPGSSVKSFVLPENPRLIPLPM